MSTMQSVLAGKGDKRVHWISPEATVLEAVGAMCTLHVGALVVGDRSHAVGMLSERDVLTRVLLGKRDASGTLVGAVMTKSVVCIGLEREAQDAMTLMTERRVRHLPVVEHKAIVGIVSIGDLVRWMSEGQEYELRSLREYVTGCG